MELLIGLLSFLFGIVLGYLGHRYQIIQGKVSIQRERFLVNISKIEELLNATLELEYATRQHNNLNREIVELKKRYQLTGEELVGTEKIANEYKRLSSKDSKKQSNLPTERRKIASEKQELLKRLREKQVEMAIDQKRLSELKNILSEEKVNLQKFRKNLWTSDIDTRCKLIDPSGKLSNLLVELFEIDDKWLIAKDSEDDNYLHQSTNVRYKIRQLLNQKIQ